MEEKSNLTLKKIQEAAMAEFLDKGFLGASLRQIVKSAGVTTEAQISFAELPEEEQPSHMGVESGSYLDWMVDYICQHREPVKLLLTRAEGTSYEHFVHNMVEVEVEYTLQYMGISCGTSTQPDG